MGRSRFTRATALSTIAAGTAAMGRSPRAGAQVPFSIRLGTLPIESAAQAFYAKDMGFFAAAGLDVDPQIVNGTTVNGVLANALDIGYATIDILSIAHQKKNSICHYRAGLRL